jgi:HlyD family secretion protein
MLKKKAPNLKWLIPLIIVGTVGLTIAQTIKWLEPPVAQSSQTRELPPRPVNITKLTSGEPVRTIKLIGQVFASEETTIRTQVDGLIKNVLVKVGDRVSPDQIVAILDDKDQQLTVLAAQARLAEEKSKLDRLEVGTRREIIAQRQAELEVARAREKEAEDNLQRLTTLNEQGAINERDLVQAKTTLEVTRNERLRLEASLNEAQSGPTPEEIAAQRALVQTAEVAVKQAELDLERTKITTDFAGVVQSRAASPGDYVESSDAILTLINPSELDIFLEVPEQLIGQVDIGQEVTVTARAIPGWQEKGKIDAILPGTEAATRRQVVRVKLNEFTPSLLPGMALQATLELPINSEDTVFIVPRDALTKRNEQWLIFAVENNQAQEYTVEILGDMGEKVAISNPDLQTGQTIVISGGDGLNQGTSVKIVNEES